MLYPNAFPWGAHVEGEVYQDLGAEMASPLTPGPTGPQGGLLLLFLSPHP